MNDGDGRKKIGDEDKTALVLTQDDIEKWFGILEYLLFKITFFALAAIGAYHLVFRG